MTVYAIQVGVYVWLMTKVDEIRHHCDRYPLYFFMRFSIFLPLAQKWGICLDIVVAPLTFRFGWQASRLTSISAGMAINAEYSFFNMRRMSIWKWLLRCSLGYYQAENRDSQDYDDNDRAYNPKDTWPHKPAFRTWHAELLSG
jgi:hypothetical protein